MGILFAFGGKSRGPEADGADEFVEIVDDALIEAVELRSALAGELAVHFEGREKARGQRSVDALEQLQEDEADRIAAREEPVAAGVRQLLEQTFGT